MDSPIFVVGSMRSGSTLLRLVLDSHDRIAIGHETGFMGAVAATTQIPGWLHGKDWYARLGWSREELEERLADFYGGMFARYAAEQGKSRWGDKTPFHTSHMRQLARIFPSSVFIGIVRHPGAVASSLRDKFHYTFTDGLAYWEAVNIEMVAQAAELGSRFTLCRYEDLVTEPERVTRELMDFLGEDWSPKLLEHHRVQRLKGTPRTVEGKTDSQDPIATDRADRWLASASPEDLVEIDSRVAELAEFFGYGAGQQKPPGESASAGPLLLTGAEINDRVIRWEGRVDFTAQGHVVAPDTDLQELAARAARAETALARARSRRVVMLSEALRRAGKDRSLASLGQVWRAVQRRR
jgi:hypothetical protein